MIYDQDQVYALDWQREGFAPLNWYELLDSLPLQHSMTSIIRCGHLDLNGYVNTVQADKYYDQQHKFSVYAKT